MKTKKYINQAFIKKVKCIATMRERNAFNSSFIYCYMALDIICIIIITYIIVKDHSDIGRRNLLLPLHAIIFLINNNGFFYMHHPTNRIVSTTAFVTSVVVYWLKWEIAQWGDQVGLIWVDTLPLSYILVSWKRAGIFEVASWW